MKHEQFQQVFLWLLNKFWQNGIGNGFQIKCPKVEENKRPGYFINLNYFSWVTSRLLKHDCHLQ